MDLKLGKLAATKPAGLRDLAIYSRGPLPAPPKSVAVPVTAWGMDLNDQLGDCVMAGVDHLLGAWNTETSQHDQRPTDDQIRETYFRLTGGADAGLNENDVLGTWRGEGLFGNRIRAYAPVPAGDLVQLQQAIAFYGGAMLGIACPASAQQDFANSRPWTYDPSSPIEGGHCIVAVGYSPSAVWCVSWGSVVEVTYPFLAHLCDEAWCVLSNEMVEAKGDALGLDLASLEADLSRL